MFGYSRSISLRRPELALGVAEPVHRDVDRDVDAELPGQLPLVADHVGLAEVGPPCGDAIVTRPGSWRGTAPGPCARRRRRSVPRAAPVRPEPPRLDGRVREAEGEHRADARSSAAPSTAASAWSGVFMMCDQSTSVVMPALRHSRAPHWFAARTSSARYFGANWSRIAAEVGAQGVVGRAGPDRRLPRVAVGVDEAGDHDVAGRVDDPRVGGRDGRPTSRSCRPRPGRPPSAARRSTRPASGRWRP